MNPKSIVNFAIIVIFSFILLSLFYGGANKTKIKTVPYSTFYTQAKGGNVTKADLQGNSILFEMNGVIYKTSSSSKNLNLDDKLSEWGVTVTNIEVEGSGFLDFLVNMLPIFFLIGVWMWFMRKQAGGGGGAMSLGKSKAKRLDEGEIDTRFSDVAGCEEAKFEVAEIVDYMRNPSKFHAVNADIPRGLLMLGPPGTGKTLLARAVAGEAKLPFFRISGSDFVEMLVGVGASRVRDLFDNAKACTGGSIIFIDELDAIGGQRGGKIGVGGHSEQEQTLNQILVEMDGFDKNANVIVIAATNRADTLDAALLRPGRFTRQVTVGLPDVGGRQKILELHAKCTPLAEDVNFKELAQTTPGMSGADLANLINEGAIFAARDERDAVNMGDFHKAIEKVTMGPERKTAIITDAEKANTGMHEAAHCIMGEVAHIMGYHKKPNMVTVMPRGQALGVTSFLNSEDTVSQNKGELFGLTLTLLAGRIGEWIHHGKNELKISTGASSDLTRASQVVRAMIKDWGFSTELGPITAGEDNYGRPLASPETLAKADEIAKDWLNAADVIVREFITEHEKDLRAMTDMLVEKETIRRDDIDSLLGHLVEDYKDVRFEDVFDIEVQANKIAKEREAASVIIDKAQL